MTSGRPADAWPRVHIVEEIMREGMQIERRSISTRQKIELLNALSHTGLRTIVVGSFVSPRWVPQMNDIDEVVRSFAPVDGVEYRGLALNDRGVERRRAFVPPLSEATGAERYRTRVHLSDVFVRRNTNRSQQYEIDRWTGAIERARAEGAAAASIELNAAWGSNWEGEFSTSARMDMLDRQHRLWSDAGVDVTRIWLGDPMGWNTPWAVGETLAEVMQRWPKVERVHLHLHDTRGLALVSAMAALDVLESWQELTLDCSVGGIGGCPYCGNGRATGMIATEDLVHMLEQAGVDTGVDLDRLVDVGHQAERMVGRRLHSRVIHTGAFPRGERRYASDLPLVETYAEARHFLHARPGELGAAHNQTASERPSAKGAM